MAITQGENANASDFIDVSERNATPANDVGRVVKLESDGFLSFDWLHDIGTSVDIDVAESTYDATSTHPETTLLSSPVPAGTLGTADGIRFTFYLSSIVFPAGGATMTLRLKYGSTTLATFTYTSSNTLTLRGVVTGLLLADGSASAQKGMAEARLIVTGFEEAGDATVGINKFLGMSTVASTENSATALNLVLTADYDAAGAGRTTTAEFVVVEKIQTRLNA